MALCNIIEVSHPNQSTIWANQEYGIRSNDEFKQIAARNLCEDVTDVLNCWFKGAAYSFSAAQKRISAKANNVSSPKFDDTTPIGTQARVDKIGLAIFLHGLNGQPSLWDDHAALFSNFPMIDVYIPEVPQAGHLSIHDKSTYLLLDRIVDWTKGNPGKPVGLFGQSKGTPPALLLETLLRDKAPSTPVHASFTVGPLYGTSTIDLAIKTLNADQSSANSLGFLSPIVCQELSYGNDTAKKLVGNAREPLANGVAERDYVMYASLHDTHVPDTGSSLPILNPTNQTTKKERHYLVTNYGHNAIVKALATKHVNDCITFMERVTGVKL